MCGMSVLCPLCDQTTFHSIDALRHNLIKAANGPLACPLCHEQFLGLDKLTIHLFSHGNNMLAIATPTTITTTTTATAIAKALNDDNVSVLANVATQAKKLISDEMANIKNEKIEVKSTGTTDVVNNDGSYTGTSQSGKATRIKKAKQTRPTEQRQQQQQQQQPLQQHQQAAMPSNTLVTCDICEFTFRNAALRDMHVRLVHQHLPADNTAESKSLANTLINNNNNNSNNNCNNDPDFKCHLCAKHFKLKVQLKVHLKVVHLLGLPMTTSTPKLSICDRIRHKESNNKVQTITMATQQQQINCTSQLITAGVVDNASTIRASTYTTDNSSSTTSVMQILNKGEGNDMVNLIERGELLPPTIGSSLLLAFNATTTGIPPTTTAEPIQPDLNYQVPESKDDQSGKLISTADTNPKIWECDVCTKCFTTKYFLKKHKRLHTGEMPYTCEICARTFTFQQSYHKHLLYHSDEKPHVCDTCGRAFKELSTLHNHERIHSGEKPFKCEVCGKCFRQRVSFLVHTRIHTGIMPYKCELCQKSFRYKVSQRTHKCLLKLPDMNPGATPTTTTSGDSVSSEGISEQLMHDFWERAGNDLIETAQQLSPASHEIANITNGICHTPLGVTIKTTLDEALLTKTIDDIVVESCHKMGIGTDDTLLLTPTNNHPASLSTSSLSGGTTGGADGTTDGSSSPLEKLQHMRLYSPQLSRDREISTDTTSICAFSRFLMEGSDNHLL